MIVVGSTLAGRFELRRRIGGGGMGEVYEAHDKQGGELVALKTLTHADGDTLLRFKREFRALQSTAHPNLAALRELVSDGEQWFFTMELVRGRHFLEYVRRDVRRLRLVLPQLVEGLRGLHEIGLVHRDVKPSNVMVDAEGRVVVLDFGLATPTDPGKQSVEGRATGTIDYMAPEQAVGAKVTPAADWYSVGVMMFEALTGQVPYTGHALQILMAKQQTDAPLVTSLMPDAPADLTSLIRDLLRIEAADRPAGTEIARRVGASPHTLTPMPRGSTMGGRSEFVGRDAELAALSAAKDRSRVHPLVHLVIGESGIGKSELVGRWCARAAAADSELLVLRGRCYERESVPYKALDGVIDGLTEHLLDLPAEELEAVLPPRPALLLRAFPVFRRVEAIASARLAVTEAGEPHEIRRRVFDALRALIGAVAARRPVVIAIDDLHWADSDSFALLRELLRGAQAPRVLVAATMRDGGAGDALTAKDIAQRLEGVAIEQSRLGPLSAAESKTLVERIGLSLVGRVDVDRAAREAGGHPMFLRELLRHLDTGATTATLDDALWSRVALLEPDAMALLGAICVAGAPISFDVAMTAARLDAITLPRAAAALRVANLAREIQRGRALALEPYHDRVREAVLGRLDEGKRTSLHARLALALEDGSRGDSHQLYRHFLNAGLADRAAHYAEQAAALSHDAHAFDQAASLWREALELVQRTPEDRRRLYLRLGEALASAGRGSEAAAAYTAAAEGADRPTWLTCQRHIAEQLLITGHIERGVEHLQRLLEEIGVHAPGSQRAVLFSLVKNRVKLRLRGLGAKLRERHEISDAEILRLDVLAVAATGLSVVDSARGNDFQTRALLLALESGSRPHIARALGLEGTYYATQGNPKRAHALRDRARAIDDESKNPYLASLLAGSEGISYYMEGDARRSAELLAKGEALMRAVPGANWELSSVKLFVVFNLRSVGDYQAMRRGYDAYMAEAQERGDHYLSSTMRRGAVVMWLAEDDPEGARADLARATWVASTDSFHVQHFHALLGDIEIALYTGDRSLWKVLHAELDRCFASLIVRVISIRAQGLYARARMSVVDGDLRTAASCAKKLAKLSSRSAKAWSLILHGCVARAKGDTETARARFTAAADVSDAAGMHVFAAMARWAEAELAGDADAAASQRAILVDLGVVAPEKLTAAFVPRAPGTAVTLPTS
ncbi:MAG: protein kinase [Myxococcales bacterium]|nr:protein kinase [Myxococcales bacterium]